MEPTLHSISINTHTFKGAVKEFMRRIRTLNETGIPSFMSSSATNPDEWHQFAEEFSESSEKLVTGEKNRSFSGRSRRLSSSR